VGEVIAGLEEVAGFGEAGVGTAVAIDGAAARAAWMKGTAVDFEAGFKEFV
jgi:sarcosine oxidase gamma subunit